MQRRRLIQMLTGLTLAVPAVRLLAAAGASNVDGNRGGKTMRHFDMIEKSESEWRQLLSAEEFDVLRKEGTEPPFSSPLNEEKREGTFVCAGCALPLFRSDWKYESGTGWPSFWNYIDGHLGFKRDWKLLLPRTEYHCARCGGHQGHVFDDGPRPTGKRYCNNGAALDFEPLA